MKNMAYSFDTTPEKSALMKKIHGKDTKAEVVLRKALWKHGYRYRKNYNRLPGKPDIALTKYKIAIFVDGKLWHGYDWEKEKTRIKSNRDYWIPKIERNIKHDHETDLSLADMGWRVIRFWDFEILKNLSGCIKTVEDTLLQEKIDNCVRLLQDDNACEDE